jgi:anti-sigma B factor antagonist
MTPASPSLFVAIIEQVAVLKIVGRANVTASMQFKTVATELSGRGFKKFVLDLSECVTMDSTFLGVLAGFMVKFMNKPSSAPSICVELLNPSPRVTDLIENLGVAHLFHIMRCPNAAPTVLQPADSSQPAPSREEVSKTCLEAHQLLMALNPDNVPKFKDVALFLAEDLKRIQATREP